MIGAYFAAHPGAGPVPPAEVLDRLAGLGITPGMLVSLALWMAPAVGWEFSVRSATAEKEPFGTRLVHLDLKSLAQVLVPSPVPGLRMRFLPAAPALVVAAIAYARKIRMEERHLQALFGGRYEEYRRRTGGLLPRTG